MPDSAADSLATSRGCSLLEVLVATTFLVVSLAAAAQLFAVAAHASHRAKETTFTTVLAQQKMEELLPDAASGAGLGSSPPGALTTNVGGFCDFVGARGNVLGGGVTPPSEAVYLRRWSIEPLSTSPADTLVIQVLVTGAHGRGAADTSASRMLLPGEAHLVTLRSRRAS